MWTKTPEQKKAEEALRVALKKKAVEVLNALAETLRKKGYTVATNPAALESFAFDKHKTAPALSVNGVDAKLTIERSVTRIDSWHSRDEKYLRIRLNGPMDPHTYRTVKNTRTWTDEKKPFAFDKIAEVVVEYTKIMSELQSAEALRKSAEKRGAADIRHVRETFKGCLPEGVVIGHTKDGKLTMSFKTGDVEALIAAIGILFEHGVPKAAPPQGEPDYEDEEDL